ncbi:type-F conjugative transfer system pilin assembly protein TrbC [Pseudoduganella sp. UC29_71]|uniref:type-F conjugative transfer system pilin assembly protein TrbC n=1 Tax=Pseudoduganella sp. UC29_71 TaxID=3350174 RepID=UPI003673448A
MSDSDCIVCNSARPALGLLAALCLAMSAGPAASAEATPNAATHHFDRLPRPQSGAGIDLAQVARGYEAAGVGTVPANTGPRLSVFISLSMPEGTLRRLAADAPRAGAVLVLRGLLDGSMTKTAARIRQLTGGGQAVVQIDPKAFARFGISHVPAVVLAREAAAATACQENGCAAPNGYVSVAGDVTLGYALDHVARSAPAFALEARRLRARLEP